MTHLPLVLAVVKIKCTGPTLADLNRGMGRAVPQSLPLGTTCLPAVPKLRYACQKFSSNRPSVRSVRNVGFCIVHKAALAIPQVPPISSTAYPAHILCRAWHGGGRTQRACQATAARPPVGEHNSARTGGARFPPPRSTEPPAPAELCPTLPPPVRHRCSGAPRPCPPVHRCPSEMTPQRPQPPISIRALLCSLWTSADGSVRHAAGTVSGQQSVQQPAACQPASRQFASAR